MKIALMTWFHYNNYGTVLQAAALSAVLRKMGHEVDVIDYFPEETCFTLPDNSWRAQVLQRIRRRRKMISAPVVTTQISGDAFKKFRDKYLTMTHFCSTRADLERLNEEYDAFICGSDRIWMPMHFDSHFYLDFVRDPHRMIAYAPSILDTGNVDQDVRALMEELIKRFIYLSVREEDGRKYLDQNFSEKTEELADPTLLIEPDEWDGSLQLTGENEEEEHYLLVMFQSHGRGYHDAAAKLASRLSLPIVTIPIHMADLGREGVIRDPIGPQQFVSMIRNADYICTDSYHGTLLSIVFQKEFCCFDQYTDREELPLNARTEHILNAVGLSGRRYSIDSPLEQYLTPIDYIPVNYKLEALKLKSRTFLQNSLKEIDEYNAQRAPENEHILQGYTLCCGCAACEAACPSSAITMITDELGALRARVDEEKCTRCEACTSVCPFMGSAEGSNLIRGKLLSYRDEDETVLDRSSAGGAAGRLMDVMLHMGMAVAGCAGDEEQLTARHVLITPEDMRASEDASEADIRPEENEPQTEDTSSPEDAPQPEGSPSQEDSQKSDDESQSEDAPSPEDAGSRYDMTDLSRVKYLQSDLSLLWKALKEYEGPSAIFGTPCQIASARKLFSERDNITYVDIVCSGIPSRLTVEKYLRSRQSKKRRLRTSEDVLARMTESELMNCEMCYDCRWRDRSAADLRIGTLHESCRKEPGEEESSIFCLTEKGQNVINALMIDGYWEGLHKQDIVGYITAHPSRNHPKPVFYGRLMEKLADEKVSAGKILYDFVKPVEQKRHAEGSDPFYYV